MFVSFEGPEGSGKSTQAILLAEHLQARGYRTVLTREPGGTALGDRLRELLMRSTEVRLTPRAETLLFCAARAELVEEVVRPRLAEGYWVICDRYSDSTLAYQAYGRGLDPAAVQEVISFATGGLLPDLTVLLDLPPEEGLHRKGLEGDDRFEREALAFHCRVRTAYLDLARCQPQRWLVVDARLPVAEAAGEISARVDRLLGTKCGQSTRPAAPGK